MPYVERNGESVIIGTYLVPPAGVDEEYLDDYAPEIVEFRRTSGYPNGSQELLNAQFAIGIADALNVAQNFGAGDRFADSFATTDYIDLDVSSNLDTSVSGEIKAIIGTGDLISPAGLDVYGGMTGGGGLAAAFDGDTTKVAADSAQSTGTSGYIITDSSEVPQSIHTVKIYEPTDGFSSGGTVTLSLYGKTGSFPESSTNGMLLGSVGPFTGPGGTICTIPSSDITTEWDYRWVVASTSAGIVSIAQIEYYSSGPPEDMSLSSSVFGADAAPNNMRGLVFVEYPSGTILNTDILISFSRDGGTSTTDAVLSEVTYNFTNADHHLLQTDIVDVSAQGEAAEPMYIISTNNNKSIKILSTNTQWWP